MIPRSSGGGSPRRRQAFILEWGQGNVLLELKQVIIYSSQYANLYRKAKYLPNTHPTRMAMKKLEDKVKSEGNSFYKRWRSRLWEKFGIEVD